MLAAMLTLFQSSIVCSSQWEFLSLAAMQVYNGITPTEMSTHPVSFFQTSGMLCSGYLA